MPFFEPEDDPRRQLLPRGAGFALPTFFAPARGGQQRSAPVQKTGEWFVRADGSHNLQVQAQLADLHDQSHKDEYVKFAKSVSRPEPEIDDGYRRLLNDMHLKFLKKERDDALHHNKDMLNRYHTAPSSQSSRRDLRNTHIDQLHGKIQIAIAEHRNPHVDDTTELYNFELAAEYDVSTKIFLFFLFYPFRCTDVHDSLICGYKSSQQPFWVATKYVLALAVLIQFIFALTWLVQAQLSLSLCGDAHVALSTWSNLNITKKITGHPFTCPELLSYCKIPTLSPAQSLDSYYTARILLYIFSLVPMAIIYGKSAWRTLTLLSPIHGGSCCSGEISNFYAATSICIVGTHLIGGIIAAIIDTGTIQYLNGLPGVSDCGKPWNTAVLDPVNFPQDAECACASILRPEKENGLLSMSKVEIMHPKDLAIALAAPNFVYLVWGFIFLIQASISRSFFKVKDKLPERKNGLVKVNIQPQVHTNPLDGAQGAQFSETAAQHAAQQKTEYDAAIIMQREMRAVRAKQEEELAKQKAAAEAAAAAHAQQQQQQAPPYPYAMDPRDPYGGLYATL